ncbi:MULTISPECIES: hypothetical protein [Cyanophyceae]|uniref:hypothetical protein n=1 Tax=Cyanophyceae TaxID=3028117 RepID=UPI0016856872|nr:MULTISPECIES: hypothetical protein [Cyanophyceae]MBD1916629.1 hypothetical protein [Phormidium sp. FACHB-77]MBD2032196.1 hypothetical protein [Phormidium sp. FACHB-322]MBD2053076.1 hypothetical protein [Leptolyngbya sp. FACHB-60]
MPLDPNILFIKTVRFLTRTEIDLFGARKLGFSAAETMARKLIEVGVININSHEEAIFKKHYQKYISLSNKLGSQAAILVLLIILLFTLATIFYMHELTYLLYQQGIRRGSQIAYSDSFAGTHEFVWGTVFLLLWFYFIWKFFIEEIVILEEKEKNSQEADKSQARKKIRSLEPVEERLTKILITLFLMAIFLAAWGSWIAFSTYPSFTSRVYVLAGAIGTLMFIGLILSILFGILLFALTDLILKRSIPDSIIVSELGQLILLLNDEPSIDFGSIVVKNNIIRSLEGITFCFSNLLPRKIRVRNIHEKALLVREFKKIANGFQSLQTWVYSPMSDTREALFLRLKNDFSNILSGNYHDLPKIEQLLSADISLKDFLINQAKRWINLLFRISLPFLTLWMLELSPIKISSDATDYLLIGSFAFSVLIFVVEIDPDFGEKLAFLKNIQELLTTRKSDR